MALPQLADVKTYLNIAATKDDAELQQMLDEAVAAIGELIGPLATTAVTEEIDTHGYKIVLAHTPAVSITSVMVEPWLGADPIDDTAAWRLNTATGVMRRKLQSGVLPFIGPGSVFTITYSVGWTSPPEPVFRAILMQVRHMWETQRGAMPLPAGGMDDALPAYRGSEGFLHPDVMDILLPYLRPPGVA